MEKKLRLIQEENWQFEEGIWEFLTPKKIYLPIQKEDTILMKQKKIKKNDCLWVHNGEKIYSPISGEIQKIVIKKNYLKEKCTYLLIQNDFKENDNYEGVSNTTMIITNDIIKRLQQKKELEKFKNKKNIILCGMEEEPFIKNRSVLHKIYKKEILLQLDVLKEAFQIEGIRILLKENDEDSILAFEQIMNTYPYISIQMIPGVYPNTHPVLFNQYFKILDDDVLVTTEDIIDLYYEIIKLRHRDFLFLTITGSALKKSLIAKVKIGTHLKEVIQNLEILGSYDLILNCLLNGVEIMDEDFILTEDVRALFFMKKQEEKEESCILCGKCNEVCPMNQNPYKSVKTKGNYKNKNCISCGLCSYVCPSKINIRKYLRRD